MADKKKQHFLPQSYLRRFGVQSNNKIICMLNVKSGNFSDKAAISGQCQGDYFYTKESDFEGKLGVIESNFSSAVGQMIASETLPKDLKAYYEMYLTVPMMVTRVKKLTEVACDMAMERIFREGITLTDQEESDLRRSMRKLSVRVGARSKRVLLDLECRLLRSVTRSFLTSDNPVITINPAYQDDDVPPGRTVGLSARGLQVYLPISPAFCMIYYDEMFYSMPRSHGALDISASDVTELNRLQILNCDEVVYFSNSAELEEVESMVRDCVREKSGGGCIPHVGRFGEVDRRSRHALRSPGVTACESVKRLIVIPFGTREVMSDG
ncbi:DUF4238 domain-containing protein [Verrucomicrobium sp. BvORR106]|uniref:DUF4238 domain-containing protein n=1 Tax=Verrucomicrobium sp. BvORR106 TaxID=1403819 RepID=UPI0005714AAB|nr:DUF4238 domain-containing protein [Verrucomicrobium sp. BvORR106]